MQAPRSWWDWVRATPPRWVLVFRFCGGRASFVAHGTPRAWFRRVLRNAQSLAHLLGARVVDEDGDD